MTPAERCANAVSAGKFKSTEAWCAAVCVSDDPRVPKEMRDWAHKQLTASMGSRSWVMLLAARRNAGQKMAESQLRAIDQLLGKDDAGSSGL